LLDELPVPFAKMVCSAGARQLARYVVAGFCVTQFAAFVYWSLASSAHVNPLIANVISTACGICLGYLVHDRWSFAEGAATGEHRKVLRFGITASLAFSFNSFWVWLLVSRMHLSPAAPVPVMMFLTPWASFLANRYWVFAAAPPANVGGSI
jgi:putative flippase GtrA